jgi:hypothetical protein
MKAHTIFEQEVMFKHLRETKAKLKMIHQSVKNTAQ